MPDWLFRGPALRSAPMRRATVRTAIAVSLVTAACGAAPKAPPIAPAPAHAAAREASPANARDGATTPAALRYASAPPPAPEYADADRAAKLAALVPKLEKRVDDFFAKEKPPSLAVAMVADGKVAFVRVLGVRDKASGKPATERTMYRIGSISKTFTATLVLSLRDEGRLRLDDPAETYLPELAHVEYPFRDAPRITLAHLLTHTSGLPRLGDFDYTRPDRDVSEADMLGALDRAKLVSAPGTRYLYSNYGLSLVGEIVARRAPEGSLRAALAKRVTGPLGMTSTAFDPKGVPDAEPATGYAKRDDAKPATPWRLGASEAAGGIWSTAGDMAKWIAFQLDAWPPRAAAEAGPVARATRREAHVPHFALGMNARVEGEHVKAKASAIGFAWHSRETCAYERIVEHGGAIDGFHAAVGFAPERGFGFVVLASSIDTPTTDLRDALFDEAAPVLGPREARPAPETTALVSKLASTFGPCGEAEHAALFTKGFRAAVPFARYAEICKGLAKDHGACRLDKTVSLDSPRDGQFALACDKGGVRVTAHVTDEDGAPRFGGLFVRSTGLPPSKDTLKAAGDVLGLYARWDAARFKALFAKPEIEARVKAGFEKQRAETGACRLAPGADKDGRAGDRGAALALACDKGPPTELALELDDKGKITTVLFHPQPGAPKDDERRCVDPPKPKK